MSKKITLIMVVLLLMVVMVGTMVACGEKDDDDTTTFTITFDSKGGSNVNSIKVREGSLITKPQDPTKEGYVFDGWYLDSKYLVEWDFSQNKASANITLHAKWDILCDHTLTHNQAVEPTCTQDGVLEHWSCSLCGRNYADENANYELASIVDATKGHAFGTWEATTPATCTTDGEEERSCSVCNHKESRELDAFGHDLVFHDAKEPTDTSVGWNDYEECIRCDYTTYQEIPMLISMGLEYRLSNDGTYYIVIGIGTFRGNTLNIPAEHEGKPVKVIFNGAFQDITYISGVKLPDSITVIGNYAFSGCRISSIELPDGLESIGSGAFMECEYLVSVVVPDSVTSIGSYAFGWCNKLKNITLSNNIVELQENEFANCNALEYNEFDNAYYLGSESNPYLVLVKAVSKDVTSCNIHNDTKIIAGKAFQDCTSIATISLPSGLTCISNYAFDGCTSLSGISIPDSVINIGNSAFARCNLITNMTLPSNLAKLGVNALSSTLQYTEYDNAYYIGSVSNPLMVLVKAKSTDITYCNISNQTKIIYAYAFLSCNKLESITIPGNVSIIGDQAFNNCTKLQSATISSGVKSLGSYAFNNCTALESITLPDSVNYIGYSIFRGCSSLRTAALPDYIYINSNAFENCTSLVSVNIPIPTDLVTGIGAQAFYGCSSLRSVVIPEGIVDIEPYTFYGCTNLERVYLPSTIRKVGANAFGGCENLQYNDYNGGKYLGNIDNAYVVLMKYSGADNYIVNEGTKVIADASLEGLVSIVIPESVRYIGENAFANSVGIAKLYYGGSDYYKNNIVIHNKGNGYITNGNQETWYYYSEEEPTADGDYWHYDSEGNVVEW